MNPQILTPSGYKDWEDLNIGDDVCAFNMETGAPEINQIEAIEIITPTEIVSDVYTPFQLQDAEGSDLAFSYFKINGVYNLFTAQSVWNTPTTICHAKDLAVGDTIYDDADNPLIISSIEEISGETQWVRFRISGDHSYIADGLTIHNAARFWVTGGVDDLWATIGNWSTTSGGGGGSAVPLNTDDVTFDNLGNHACTMATSNRVAKTMTIATGYTSLWTFTTNLAVSGSITLANAAFTYTGAGLLRMITTGTWTTNGKSIGVSVEIGGTTTFTCTLADDLAINQVVGVSTVGLSLTNTTSTIFSGAHNISITSRVTNADLAISGTQTVTLSGNITCNSGGLGIAINDANLLAGSFIISAAGGLTMTGTLGISANSPTITLTGGAWSGTAVCSVPITITGAITVSGQVAFSGTLTNSGGSATTTGSELDLAGGTATTLDTSGITWADIVLTGTSKTFTLNSNLSWSGTMTISSTTAVTWTGAFTMQGGDMSITTAITATFNVTSVDLATSTGGNGLLTLGNVAITLAGSLATFTGDGLTTATLTVTRIHTLTNTISFRIRKSLTNVITGANSIRWTLKSSSAGNKVTFYLDGAGTQSLLYADPTDIDSNLGQTIFTDRGTITTTNNWTTSLPINVLPASLIRASRGSTY